MGNLLKETKSFIKRMGKEINDVKWVGSEDSMWFTWEHFEKIADVEYDKGFGGQEVAEDLLVVGSDWWLERHEYDGSEWWEFKELPIKPDKHKEPKKVVGGLWATLDELND